MQMSQAIAEYTSYRLLQRKENTVKNHEQALKRFCLYVRNKNIQDIQLVDIIEYLKGMQDLGWYQNSIREQACILRRFFRYERLTGNSEVHEDLIPTPRRVYSRHNTITDEEHQSILKVIPNESDPRHVRNMAMITLLHDTGVRCGELLSLKVSDLNIEKMSSIVRTEKVSDAEPWRQIFWTKHAHGPLLAWLKKREYLIQEKRMWVRDPDILFFNVAGRAHGEPTSRNGLSACMKSYCKRAGIRSVNPHAYRHRFGHEVVRRGGTNSDVSNLLGHANLASSFVYTQMSGSELHERYNKIYR